MNHLKFLLLSLWLALLPTHAADFLPPDQAFAFSAQMQGGQTAHITFVIAPSYYMYRDEFKFAVVSPDGSVVQNGAVKLPVAQTKFDENFNKELAIYHDRVAVDVPIKKIADSDGLFKIVVTSRGCADKGLCYPPRQTQAVLTASAAADTKVAAKPVAPIKTTPEKPVQPPVVAPQAVATAPSIQTAQATAAAFDNSAVTRDVFAQHNLFYALAIILGLGVLLSLTPCMLPMLPVLSAMLAGQRNVSRGRGFLLALAYVTGMASVYALIGVMAAQTGAGLHQYLQSPWMLGGLALMLTLLALSLFDVFQLQLPTSWQTWLVAKTQGKHGYTGAAILGAASALIASPCVTAPLVGIITYIVQSRNAALGGLALFILAYGMGLPLLLLGAGLGQFLPKSGAWMLRIKQAIGVLMFIAALWVAQPLWGKYWQTAWGTPQAALVFAPIQNNAELDMAITQSKQPIVLDLYADWCRSCIEMEQKTFSDPSVRQAMSSKTLLRVDMSHYTEAHAALLQRFNLYGPPAVMILEPITGRETIRVIGFEPADVFVERLRP